MKPAAIVAYEGIQEKLPGLLYITLSVLEERVFTTGYEAHEIVEEFRPGTAYSSVRARFWELENMGLIVENGVKEVRLGGGKKRPHTRYCVTPAGQMVMELPADRALATLQRCAKIITVGRKERAAAMAGIKASHDLAMARETRNVIRRALED